MPPVLELCRVFQNVEQKRLVVSLQEDRFVPLATFDEQIYGAAGFRPAIDVVAEKNMKGSPRADRREISIYYGEHLLKQIGAAVDVRDGVDAYAVRQLWLSNFALRFRQSQHFACLQRCFPARRPTRESVPAIIIVNDLLGLLEVFDSI